MYMLKLLILLFTQVLKVPIVMFDFLRNMKRGLLRRWEAFSDAEYSYFSWKSHDVYKD